MGKRLLPPLNVYFRNCKVVIVNRGIRGDCICAVRSLMCMHLRNGYIIISQIIIFSTFLRIVYCNIFFFLKNISKPPYIMLIKKCNNQTVDKIGEQTSHQWNQQISFYRWHKAVA